MRSAVFAKQLLVLGAALIPLWGCMSTQAGAGTASTTPPAGIATVTQAVHPAGPSVRREWRVTATGPVVRLELERARSGQWVIGQTRLIRNPDGAWSIVQADGQRQILDTSGTPQTFSDAGKNWRVRVTAEEVPVERPGIATETEPSLNLTMAWAD